MEIGKIVRRILQAESYFIKAENQERGKSEFHGVGGPLSVSDQRIQLPLLNEFQNAAEEFGIPKTKDFNTGDNHEAAMPGSTTPAL